jgi:chitodextrinase
MKTADKIVLVSRAGAIALALALFAIAPTAAAGRDRTKPTTPGNFRVTAVTAYTVTVAWNPSSDDSGSFHYHLSGAYGVAPVVLPRTATSHTFAALYPRNDYWFFIYARDAAGNASGQGNTTTRTLADTTPPWTAPVVTVTELGSTYAELSWTPAQDDGPHQFSEVWVNGSLDFHVGKNITSTTVQLLEPETAYTFQVRAYDYGNNRSPFSDAVDVLTPPPNPADTTPPTTPGNLAADTFGDGSTETSLRWTQSTDDFDPQSNIRYDIFVNGVWQDVVFGSGGPRTIYADFGESLIEVIASDTAGNESEPATVVVFF